MADMKRRWRKEWEGSNPVLRNGEPGIEIDTNRLKVGDGKTVWTKLNYVVGVATFENSETITSVSPPVVQPIPQPAPAPVEEPTINLESAFLSHIYAQAPHLVYDEGPSLVLLYQNAKV